MVATTVAVKGGREAISSFDTGGAAVLVGKAVVGIWGILIDHYTLAHE
ncbi:MAG: hypothetical protein IPL28_26790 [Chloroflexi bacterium]|nr:hypothetical protein [Chloroflexota bacterium]